MSKNTSTIQTFEDLKVWQLARKIRTEIFEWVKKYPKTEKYRLTDQTIRSSRSISDNISEVYGRFHYQKNNQFCRIARGSAYDLINHLITANDCSYITNDELVHQKKSGNALHQADQCLYKIFKEVEEQFQGTRRTNSIHEFRC